MSAIRIIIENQSSRPDTQAVGFVRNVMEKGFISGPTQYCWMTEFGNYDVRVYARRNVGRTHSFVVMDSQ